MRPSLQALAHVIGSGTSRSRAKAFSAIQATRKYKDRCAASGAIEVLPASEKCGKNGVRTLRFALRHSNGRFLTPLDAKPTHLILHEANRPVEQFTLEEKHIAAGLVAPEIQPGFVLTYALPPGHNPQKIEKAHLGICCDLGAGEGLLSEPARKPKPAAA